jgi:SPP1 gp7 family putative phage head morphogenesis protein
MTVSFDFELEPKEAIKYLGNKGYKTSFDYDEMMHQAHHKAFTVAKVMRHDLLMDIHESLLDAQKNGTSFKKWKETLKPTLQKKGWWGNKTIVNPVTGEAKDIYIGSRRLNTIFNTNMRVAHSVQRFKQMRQLNTAVFWRYLSEMLPKGRKTHKKVHGTFLHRDDAFWQTNYPPNGWNCRCKVQALSQKQAAKRGYKVNPVAPATVADKDWAYNVGDTSNIAKMTRLNLGSGLTQLLPNSALAKLSDAQLKSRFYNTLGVKEGELFIDKVGDPLYVGDDLFKATTTSKTKLMRDKRALYMDELAKTISDPDEIYLETEVLKNGKVRLLKKMFRFFKTAEGKVKGAVSLFEYQPDKTISVSSYVLDNKAQADKRRIDRLVYQKEK